MADLINVAQLDAPIGISGMFMCCPDSPETIHRTIKQKWNGGGTVVLMTPVMGAARQGIFLAFIALAAKHGEVTKPTLDEIAPMDEYDIGRSANLDIIRMHLSYQQVADTARVTNNGRFREDVRDAVQAFSGITVRGQGADENFAISRLMFGSCGRGKEGIDIAICWRLALGVLGDGIYGSIRLDERYALRSETARVMHAWAACWLGAKKYGRASVGKLCTHIRFVCFR